LEIIGYGDADVDIILNLDRLPVKDEKIQASAYSIQKGGMVPNTLVALSRLGRKVGFHGVIGDDTFGRIVVENFEANGVDTGGVVIKQGEDTFFCVLLVNPKGDRVVLSAPTTTHTRHPEDVSEPVIASANHLHTTVCFDPAGLRAMRLAKRHGLTVSLDMDAHTLGSEEELNQMLSMVDLLLFNQLGSAKLPFGETHEERARILAHKTGGIVCLTLGDKGAVTVYKDTILHTPIFEVDVVDTTGAGDSFAAGFIHAFLAGWPLENMAVFASAVAALNCQHIGGHTHAPTLREVVDFLGKRGVDLS
jgi:sulfofructose kinase